MRAFLLVGALAAAACGEVVKNEQPKADATIDSPAVSIDAAIDAPPDPNTPRIISVTPPIGVDGEGGSATIMVTLGGPPNTTFSIDFTGQLGSYVPATTTVTTNASGQATVTTTFTTSIASSSDATEMSTATVTSPTGVPPRAFQFPVVALKRQGNTTQYSGPSSFSPDYLLGEPITTTVSGKLKKIGFIYNAAGANVKVGIYTNNASNQPGTLVAQLPATAAQAGRFEVALPSPVDFPAGTYWIMGLHNTSGTIMYNSASANTVAYISLPFASALPTTFPTPSTYTGQSFNWWFVIGL